MTIPNVTEAGYYGWGVYHPVETWPYVSTMIETEAKWIADLLAERYSQDFEVRPLPERKVN